MVLVQVPEPRNRFRNSSETGFGSTFFLAVLVLGPPRTHTDPFTTLSTMLSTAGYKNGIEYPIKTVSLRIRLEDNELNYEGVRGLGCAGLSNIQACPNL